MRLLILMLLLSGCDGLSMRDKTENLTKAETLEAKLQTSDKGANSYSGDPVDHITVTAAGNANITLTVGDKGKVQKNEKRDTATEEELETSFSVDYYLRSIPTTGWALIMICFCIVMMVVWWFIKTTAAGKAFDSAIAKGVELTEKNIERVRDRLSDAQKGSDVHTELLNDLSRLKDEKAEFLRQMKHKKDQ